MINLRSAVVIGAADTPSLRSSHHAYLSIVRAAVEVVQLVARFARCHTRHVSTSGGSCPTDWPGSLLLLEWTVCLLFDVIKARLGLELQLLFFPESLLQQPLIGQDLLLARLLILMGSLLHLLLRDRAGL